MVLAVVCAPVAALADPPHFSQGGFLFSVQYGPGFWALDRQGLGEQVGADNADLFITDATNTHTVTLRAAYNILGHASISADFTATGWDITTPQRGGAGFVVGAVTWHPLELVFLKKERRPIPLDVGTYFGIGYGIAGERRGMDGLLLEWGLNADWFFTRYFGLGFFARGTFFKWDNFYIDYNNRTVPGATIPLPKGSGGAFWTIGVSLTFRAGE